MGCDEGKSEAARKGLFNRAWGAAALRALGNAFVRFTWETQPTPGPVKDGLKGDINANPLAIPRVLLYNPCRKTAPCGSAPETQHLTLYLARKGEALWTSSKSQVIRAPQR